MKRIELAAVGGLAGAAGAVGCLAAAAGAVLGPAPLLWLRFKPLEEGPAFAERLAMSSGMMALAPGVGGGILKPCDQ